MSCSACSSAIEAFHEIERGCGRGFVPPVARLGTVVAFLLVLMSSGKYDMSAVAALSVYPVFLVCFERVPLVRCLRRFWFALIPVVLLGAANPFFDREVVLRMGGLSVTGGWLSFAVLALKGVLAVSVTLSLLRTTGVRGIADAMDSLRLPRSFGMTFLLMHRYFVMMIKETERMRDAYSLRSAKGVRAIGPSFWGPFVGQLLMRAMDRASAVRAAMELRGGIEGPRRFASVCMSGGILLGILYFTGWVSVFLSIRFLAPMRHIGDLILGAG